MVIADDDINAARSSVAHLFNCGNAAVNGDNQSDTLFSQPVNTDIGYAVSFGESVGNVEINVGTDAQEVEIEHGCRTCAVNIIIAVNGYLFVVLKGPHGALHSAIHVIHQEGVVQIGQAWPEELTRPLESSNATGDQDSGNGRRNVDCAY